MKVLVVGAGAAGLAAAQILSTAGAGVCVLEARHRVGGRIYTVHDPALPLPIELGAEFIHGRPSEIMETAKTAGLAASKVSERFRYWKHGQPAGPDALWPKVDGLFGRMAQPGIPDQTFAEFLRTVDAGPEVKALATNYIEGFEASSVERIGIHSLALEQQASEAAGGDQLFRLRNGYSALTGWLWAQCAAHSVELHLNTVAAEVLWRKGAVQISAVHGTDNVPRVFSADRAIVTVPLGVWKAPPGSVGAFRFIPDLPEKRRSMEHLEMGPAIRVVLVFRDSFRKQHAELLNPGFILSDEGSFRTWWTNNLCSAPVLTAWAGGPRAEQLAGLDEAALVERAAQSLASIAGTSGPDIASLVERSYLHNWVQDPFSRGAYSYGSVGAVPARQAFAQPVEDTLYFAGEATHTEQGTVHGALATGWRAAREILGSG